MLISAALAADTATAAAATSPGSLWMNLAPLLFIFVIFYFLVIRPQSKKIRQHQEMLGGLKKGDHVVTGGGFLGTVVGVKDNEVTVDLGHGLEVRALKHTLSNLQQPAVTASKAAPKSPAKKTKE
jgi:preprotein translocase subunit YajC